LRRGEGQGRLNIGDAFAREKQQQNKRGFRKKPF